MHNSWSKSVLAQWKSTRAPGRAVSALSGLEVSCSKNKETLYTTDHDSVEVLTSTPEKKLLSTRQECNATSKHFESTTDI